MKYNYINNEKIIKYKSEIKPRYMNLYKINEEKDWERKGRKTHYLRYVITNYFKMFPNLIQIQVAWIVECSLSLVKKVYAKLKKEGILIKEKNNNGIKNKKAYVFNWSITEKNAFVVNRESMFSKHLKRKFQNIEKLKEKELKKELYKSVKVKKEKFEYVDIDFSKFKT